MKKEWLFPHACQKIGMVLSVLFGLGCLLWLFWWSDTLECWQGWDELFVIGLLVGLLLAAFSRERDEDEYMTRLRYESLVWAVLADSLFVVIATLTVYGPDYVYVLLVQLFLQLILYIVRFRIVLRRVRKEGGCEK